MSALHDLQCQFLDGIFLNDEEILSRIADRNKFRIYRNNAFLILTDMLENIFPAVCALVDEKFFRYATNEYIKSCPPQSGDLSDYGENFPDFLESFEPLRAHPYVPDVARLEWLRRSLYTAKDAAPLDPGKLTRLSAEKLEVLTLRLLPCAGLLQSKWPADRIWDAAFGAALPDIHAGPAYLLIIRRGEEFEHRPLSPEEFLFISSCVNGKTLPDALANAEFADPQKELSVLLGAGVFRDISV